MTTVLSPPPSTVEAGAPYVLGRSAPEYERLRRQARQLEPLTARLLNRVGLIDGMRCLDVGSGPGEVMRLMAERVGDAGSVTGIDLDGALGRDALARLHAAGHRNCRFLEGDILTTPRPAGPGFDLVYARLVLIHAERPLDLLARMWEWTAPGGVLVVQDYDLDAIASDPPHAVLEEFRRVALAVFRHAGRPVNAGSRLRRQFTAAGLGAPDGTAVEGLLEPLSVARSMIEAVYRSVLPLALEWAVTNAAEADELLADLASAPADITVRYPLLVGAYRRKEAVS